MKWILIAGAVVAGLVLLVAVIGMLLPVKHRATRRATFRQPPEEVWRALVDVEAFPTWRKELRKVEKLSEAKWVETGSFGVITFERLEADKPRRFVGRIASTGAFGGNWTFELTPEAGGTTVAITENGEVYNPIFRFLSRFVFGHEATLNAYLKSLGRKFGEETVTRG